MKVPLPVRVIPALAERAWFTPPPLSARREARWKEAVHGADSVTITVDGVELSGFSAGAGPPVFLIHGWGGRAAQMGTMAAAIAEQGFRVVAIDAPGHGDGRTRSDVFQMAAAIDTMVDTLGLPSAVVAHSLGSMAAVRSLHGRMPERLVLLAPVLDVEVALDKFAQRARLTQVTASSLRRRVRKFIGAEWVSFVEGYRTDFGDSDLLVVHDPDDDDSPFELSAALAATRLQTTLELGRSTGHAGMLQDPETIAKVVDFITGQQKAERGTSPVVSHV